MSSQGTPSKTTVREQPHDIRAPVAPPDYLSLLVDQSAQLSSTSPIEGRGAYLHLPSYTPAAEGENEPTGSGGARASPTRDPHRHIPRSLVQRRMADVPSYPRDPLYELDHPPTSAPPVSSKQRNQQQTVGMLMHKRPHHVASLDRSGGGRPLMSPLEVLLDAASLEGKPPQAISNDEAAASVAQRDEELPPGGARDGDRPSVKEEEPALSEEPVGDGSPVTPRPDTANPYQEHKPPTPQHKGDTSKTSSALIDGLRGLVDKYSVGTPSKDEELVRDVTALLEKTVPPVLDHVGEHGSPSFSTNAHQDSNQELRSSSTSMANNNSSLRRELGPADSGHFPKGGSAYYSQGSAALSAPFVPQLVQKCISPSSSPEAPVFIHWKGMTAVLFVDMSGYSKLTTALAPFGAHALSEVVNSYLDKIIQVVSEHSGDVLKFAGDAVLVAWATGKEAEDIRCALDCALELQDRCGTHVVPQVNQSLHLHIGCIHGSLSSHISYDSSRQSMPKAYHSVSGPLFRNIGAVVDTAKSGEVCVDRETAEKVSGLMAATAARRERHRSRMQRHPKKTRHVRKKGGGSVVKAADLNSFTLWETADADVMLVERDVYDQEAFAANPTANAPEDDVGSSSDDDGSASDVDNAGDGDEVVDVVDNLDEVMERVYPMFLHSALALRLSTVSRITDVMEMRFVVVLFIHMNANSAFVVSDWFAQVLAVLDQCNCPAVQVIEDDKGVHVVAAINLYTSVLEPVEQAVKTASLLVSQELGCTVGAAAGTAFCGVIGTELVSRWDIAGACAVRACRLMQHAQLCGQPCLFDSTIYEACRNLSLITEHGTASVKGTAEPVKVYALGDATSVGDEASWMIVSDGVRCDNLYKAEALWLQRYIINSPTCCSVAVVEGPVQAGKLVLAVRAISESDVASEGGIVPLIHQAHPNGKPLDLALSLSAWFRHSIVPHIALLAQEIEATFPRGETGKVIRLLRELVDESVLAGMRIAFIIRHAHYLDSISLSFVRFIVEKGLISSACSGASQGGGAVGKGLSIQTQPRPTGKFIAILTASPVYGTQSVSAIVGLLVSQVAVEEINDVTSPLTATLSPQSDVILPNSSKTPSCAMAAKTLGRVKLPSLSNQDAQSFVKFRLGWNVGQELERLIMRKSGSIPGFMDSLIGMIQAQRPYITHLNIDGYVRVQPHQNLRIRNMPWTVVAPMVTTSLLRLYDELPARHKVLLRLIAALTPRVGESVALEVVYQVFKKVMRKDNVFFVLLQKLADLRLVTVRDVGLEYGVAAKLILNRDADAFMRRRQMLQRGSKIWVNDQSPEEELSLSVVHIALPPLRDALALTMVPRHIEDLSRQACVACGELAVEIAGRKFASNAVVKQRHQQYMLSKIGTMRARAEIASKKLKEARHTLDDLTEVAHRNFTHTHRGAQQQGRTHQLGTSDQRESLVEMLRRQQLHGSTEPNNPGISAVAHLDEGTEERLWARLIDSASLETFELDWRAHAATCSKASSSGAPVEPYAHWVSLHGDSFDRVAKGGRKETSEEEAYRALDPEVNLSMDKMSLKVVQVKNYVAPLALGPLGGYLMDIGMALREMYTEAVKVERSPPNSNPRPSPEKLCLIVGKYLEEVAKVASFVGGDGPFAAPILKSERDTVLGLCCTPRNPDDVLSFCEQLLSFSTTLVDERRKYLEDNAWELAGRALRLKQDAATTHHIVRLQAAIAILLTATSDCPSGSHARRKSSRGFGLSTSDGALTPVDGEYATSPFKTLDRMVQRFLQDEGSRDEREGATHSIPNTAFQKALLVLAQAPWSPRHKRHSLEAMRDAVLRFRTETPSGLLCSIIMHIACL